MSDIYNSSFKALYRRKLLKSIAQFKTATSDSSSDCTEWKGGLDKGNYPILKKTFKYKRYNLRVQRLLYYLESPLEWLDPKIHVSHLCHNRQCLNLEHLSYEPAAVNYQRKTCLSEGKCLGHKPFRNCLLQVDFLYIQYEAKDDGFDLRMEVTITKNWLNEHYKKPLL